MNAFGALVVREAVVGNHCRTVGLSVHYWGYLQIESSNTL